MKKEFIAVCLALFLLLFGTYISGTLLVPYSTALGGTGITIGIVYSCMYAVRLVFGAPIGRLSQRKGAKKILTYSLALYPFIAVAYWVSWNMPSLIFARLLHGVASAMLLPMGMAYIGEISPEGQEGRYMAIYNAILFAASAFGPFVGGIIYDRYGVRAAFVVLFGLAVLSCALISTMAGGWKKGTTAASENLRSDNNYKQLTAYKFLKNRRMLALGCINISIAVLLALFGASFTQLALSRRLNMGLIGILIAILNIVVGITQIPFGRFVDRHGKEKLTIISGVAAALLSACLPRTGSLWTVVLLVTVTGIFISLNLSATSALSTVIGREIGMSNTMGFLGTTNSAGTIIGYLTLGYVTDKLGVNMAFYFTAVIFLLGLGAFLLLWQNKSKCFDTNIHMNI